MCEYMTPVYKSYQGVLLLSHNSLHGVECHVTIGQRVPFKYLKADLTLIKDSLAGTALIVLGMTR